MDAIPLVERYIAEVTNEADSSRRRGAIDGIFARDVRYVDQDGAVDGVEAFAVRIDELAAMMRPGMRFSARQPLQQAGEAVIYHWRLGLPGAAPVLTGTDALLVRDGRLAQVFAVVD